MASRFDFQSTGAAANASIQEFLATRRAEERQAMIDKLSEQDLQKKWANQEHQQGIAGRAQTTNESAESRAGKMDTQNILHARLGDAPDTADPSSFSPDLYDYAKTAGRIQSTPAATPSVTTSEMFAPPEGATPEALEEYAKMMEGQPPQQDVTTGAQIPAGERFIGRPEYEKEQRDNASMDTALAGLAADKNASPDALRQAMLTRGGLMPGVSTAAAEGKKSVVSIGPTGKNLGTTELPFGGEAMEHGFPYTAGSGSAAYAPKAYQEIDTRTGRVIRTHVLNPEQATTMSEQLSAQGHVIVATTSPFGASQGQERAKDLAGREFSRAFTSGSPRVQRAAELNQARVGLIAATIVSDPRMREFLSEVSGALLKAAEERGSVPANISESVLRAAWKNFPKMSPADEAEITETLGMLLTNIPKSEAPAQAAPPPAQAPPATPPQQPVSRGVAPIVGYGAN